ncbi:hypothetical protein GQ457_09G022030 [Hibiscus cannabinus]
MSSFKAFTASIDKETIPTTIEDALKYPRWKKAVEEEIHALEKNDTWIVTDLPHDKKAIGSKWVFAIKYNSDGSIKRYKARLVAKCFTQTYDIDYKETFAPVAKLNIVRVLLRLVVNKGDDGMEISRLKELLNSEFETKDLGELRYFLGMEVARSSKGLKLNVYTRKKKIIPETILQSDTCRELNLSPIALEDVGGNSTSSLSEMDDLPIAKHKGVRQCTRYPIQKYMAYGKLMSSFKAFTVSIDKETIPTTIEYALKYPRWKKAVEEEIHALEKNFTWIVTDLQHDKKAIGSDDGMEISRLKELLNSEFETKDLGK